MSNKAEQDLAAFYEEFVEGPGIDKLIGAQERALLQAAQGGTGARLKYAAEDLAQNHGGPVVAGFLATAALANSGPTMAANAESVGLSGGTAPHAQIAHKTTGQDRIVHLHPGQEIYDIAEVVAEQRGVNTMTEVNVIERASDVDSEAEAERLPVGFALHVPAKNAKASVKYVFEPLGGNLTVTAKQNGMTLERLLELNPTYKSHPDFVEAGARLRVESEPSKPHHTDHSPAPKPAISAVPDKPAAVPKKTPVPHKPQPTPVTPEHHPVEVKPKQKPHAKVIFKPGPGFGSAFQRDLGQAFAGTAASVAKTSHQLEQNILRGVTAVAGEATGAIPRLHTRLQHQPSHKAVLASHIGECASTGHMPGKTSKQIAMNFLIICDGDSVAGAAGAVGNFMQEDYDLKPQAIQNGGFSKNPADAGKGGYGIAQWTPGSKALSESKKYGIKGPIYTLQAQLKLVTSEMKGQSPTGQHNMAAGLKRIKDPSSAAERFEQDFEEGQIAAQGGGQLSNRQKYAREAAKEFGPSALAAMHSLAHWQGGDSHARHAKPHHAKLRHTISDAAIYRAALKYNPDSYSETMPAGHDGVAQYHKTFPKVGPKSLIDCSGLVNEAVSDATGGRDQPNENTRTERQDHKRWEHIRYSYASQGDIIQPVINGHVGNHDEIINHVKGNEIYTFGAHTSQAPQPEQVGPAKYTYDPRDIFLHYVKSGALLGKAGPRPGAKPAPNPRAPAHAWKNPMRHNW
jgi:hypothetical protein